MEGNEKGCVWMNSGKLQYSKYRALKSSELELGSQIQLSSD